MRRRTIQPAPSNVPFGARIAALAFVLLAVVAPATAATLDRIKQSGRITLGYRTDARPFSYRDEAGAAAGYSVALCQKIADDVKSELRLGTLEVQWVPVTLDDRFGAVRDGKVDLLCGADAATLTRRKDVAFSISIFPSGIGALLRADASGPLRGVLSEAQPTRPIWRGSPARTILEKKVFSVVAGTRSQAWIGDRLDTFQINATVSTVPDYAAGIRSVVDHGADVFFGDRPILLDAATRNAAAHQLIVLDRMFTYEPLALGLARDDDNFRLLVDRTLSRTLRSGEFQTLYAKWFGEADDSTLSFFRQSALPE